MVTWIKYYCLFILGKRVLGAVFGKCISHPEMLGLDFCDYSYVYFLGYGSI